MARVWLLGILSMMILRRLGCPWSVRSWYGISFCGVWMWQAAVGDAGAVDGVVLGPCRCHSCWGDP